MEMSNRKQALRDYFVEVIRDLIQRGAIRRQQGQSVDDILRTEAAVVFSDVRGDFAEVAAEIGVGIATSGARMVENVVKQKLDGLVSAGGKALADIFSGATGREPRNRR